MMFDVFISAKSEDFPLARQVYDFLVAHGLNVFFSEKSVTKSGVAEYRRTIFHAVEHSRHMIVVGTRADRFSSPFVSGEWGAFLNELLSAPTVGTEPRNLVTVVGGDLAQRDLPFDLRRFEMFRANAQEYARLLNFLPAADKASPGPGGAGRPGTSRPRRTHLAAYGALVALGIAAVVGCYFVWARPSPRPATASETAHPVPANTAPAADPAFGEARDSLFGAMPWLNWVVYDPSEYDPFERPTPPEASIRQDLDVLRQHGFNGLITMTSRGACREIARVARGLGFVKIIVGVWDVRDAGEVGNALSVAPWADAYCLGHRGSEQRYPFFELEAAIARVRATTHRPATTSEVIATYESNAAYAAVGDFLFPDVHAYWHDGGSAAAAWQQTVDLARRAESLVAAESKNSGQPKRPVLLKMVSFPSDGAPGLSEAAQREFYRLAIRESPMKGDLPGGVALAFFSAFDEPWKAPNRGFVEPERHAGLFRADRSAKPAITGLDWSRKFR